MELVKKKQKNTETLKAKKNNCNAILGQSISMKNKIAPFWIYFSLHVYTYTLLWIMVNNKISRSIYAQVKKMRSALTVLNLILIYCVTSLGLNTDLYSCRFVQMVNIIPWLHYFTLFASARIVNDLNGEVTDIAADTFNGGHFWQLCQTEKL